MEKIRKFLKFFQKIGKFPFKRRYEKMKYKSGKLSGKDKKMALSDVRELRKEANTLAREIKRDLFSSGKMTLREMEKREKHIDHELDVLDNLLQSVRANHEEYHRLRNAKQKLKALKQKIKLEKKLKKYKNVA
jgi:hypothetical protein